MQIQRKMQNEEPDIFSMPLVYDVFINNLQKIHNSDMLNFTPYCMIKKPASPRAWAIP